MFKKIISIILSLMVISSFGFSTSALYSYPEAYMYYLYTLNSLSSLNISNGTATYKSQLTGISETQQ